MVAITWSPSGGPAPGIERELQLIDSRSRMLRQDERAVEAGTGICRTVAAAKADLAATIEQLQRITAERGTILACSATHPVSDWRDAKMAPIQRYAELPENLQWLARRIQTFGVHVHVGIRDGCTAIPIVNALAGFLALTASSPYWSGHDTGLASSRSVISGGLLTSGPPQLFADWSGFEDHMDTLLRAGTIRSIKELWWGIRPPPDLGTVEVRMSDGLPTLREIGMAAALSQSLVHLLDCQLDRGYTLPCPAAWVVRDNKWRAARYGLEAMAERPGCAAADALVAEFAEGRFVGPEEAVHGRA